MKKNETTAFAPSATNAPMSELTNYHQQLEEKYKTLTPDGITTSSDALSLITFNGYYSLNELAPGAFFAIDTNVHVKEGCPPINDLALLISLDGKTSARFPFAGTFENNQLKQGSATGEGLYIDLTFTRTDGSDGTTATCSGIIQLPNQTMFSVSGITYNNPIPVSVFRGDFYETRPLHLSTSSEKKVEVLVMQLNDQDQLSYDNGMNGLGLQAISTYTYNINMYFFSFTQGDQSIRLIMGTAAAGGLACNNMIINLNNNKVISRSLQTIPFPVQANLMCPNLSSTSLAAFSGYYQIPSIHPKAFISIQAQYVNVIGDDYVVMISFSMDGVKSYGYYFEEEQMTFENNTLKMSVTMPLGTPAIPSDVAVALTFNRSFNSEQGSLVTLTGSIGNTQITTGYTAFNPVPLTGFGGAPMTNPQGVSLTVVSDNEVIYDGINIQTKMLNILYVPLMYILAYPSENPTVVMSFGTDGLKGNACIITDNNGIYVVNAIP
jgi:hypothetical protein